MAYQLLETPDGRTEVRTTGGRIGSMRQLPDGTWTVLEDEQGRTFPDRGAALDFLRVNLGDLEPLD